MSMFYPARFDDYYFCWSLAKACNHLLMASPEGGDINDVEEKFASFDTEHPVLENASDLPDIGFFEPRSSLDCSPEPLKNAIWPMNVWLQGALFRNLRNAILFENDPLEVYLKYPLVVLCGANMLSDGQLELLKKYCQQGGRLLVCGTFGIYRPDGSRREHPEKVFGIEAKLSDFLPTTPGKFTWKNKTVELSPQEESRIFELEADDGTIEKLYHIATVEYKGGMYCCFQKAEPESEEEADEVIIFALKGEGEDAMLEPIEDEDVLDGVFEEFCRQYEEFEEEAGEEE